MLILNVSQVFMVWKSTKQKMELCAVNIMERSGKQSISCSFRNIRPVSGISMSAASLEQELLRDTFKVFVDLVVRAWVVPKLQIFDSQPTKSHPKISKNSINLFY